MFMKTGVVYWAMGERPGIINMGDGTGQGRMVVHQSGIVYPTRSDDVRKKINLMGQQQIGL